MAVVSAHIIPFTMKFRLYLPLVVTKL